MSPHHTHLENRFLEINYIKFLQDSLPLMLLCRNVTLRSHNTMSKRDAPIQLSHYFISASLFYSRRHFNREGSRLEIRHSHNFRPTTSHTIKYIEDFTISLNTYRSLFKVYLSNRNKTITYLHRKTEVKQLLLQCLSFPYCLRTLPIYQVYICIRCKLTIP